MTTLVDSYLSIVQEKAKKNKYTTWYLELINSRLFRLKTSSVESTESHHIAPSSIFPHLKNEADNIIILTPREHYIAHLLLYKMFDGSNQDKMLRAIFLMSSRNKQKSSKIYQSLRLKWSETMKACNPTKRKEVALKISKALTGRTKETHDYIKISAEKRAAYTEENSEWLKKSREKFRDTISQMSKEERQKLFGHECSEEQRKKFSENRRGQTKDNCNRVSKMAQTKALRASKMTDDERKKAFSTTTGYKWYHSDEKQKSILAHPDSITDSIWQPGRKFYENKKD